MEKKWWTLIVVCAGTFMLLVDVTIVIVALPSIQSGLHATFSEVQWVVDAYALTLASVLLTAGSLADRYGRRLLFSIGLVVFTLGSLLCGVAQSPIMLILSRSAQGIGGAILFATSLALLAHSFHGKERGMAFGIWGAVTGVAAGLGPVLGGVITTAVSWRGIFLVNLPIGVAAVAITRWRVEESKTPYAARPDWAGFVTLTAGLVSLVYGLIRAGEIAWNDEGVVICMALAAGFLAAFIAVELRARREDQHVSPPNATTPPSTASSRGWTSPYSGRGTYSRDNSTSPSTHVARRSRRCGALRPSSCPRLPSPMARASVITTVPVGVRKVVSNTIVRSRYRRVTWVALVAPIDQWPASSPRRRPRIEGLSKRGKHNQSIDPSRLTSAALCRSERSA